MKARIVVLASILLIALCSGAARAAEPVPNAEDGLKRLATGNERYVAGKPAHPNQDPERRAVVAKGQTPFATILACSDSRVPVEVLFDQGIGDLFVVRVAGNVSDTDEIGTIEYGVGHLNTPLLVVLGHTSCGAVKAVVEGAQVHGSIPALVDNIVPAVANVRSAKPGAAGAELVGEAVKANVWTSIDDLFKNSPEVRELVHAGKLTVVGGVYNLESGEVAWMGKHPEQPRLLAYTSGAGHGDAHGDSGAHAPAHAGSAAGHGTAALHAAGETAAHAGSHTKEIVFSLVAAVLFSGIAFVVFRVTRQSSIQVRILSNSAVLLLILLGLGGFVYFEFHRIGRQLDATANDALPILITLSDAETKVVKQALFLEKFALTKDPALVADFDRFAKEVEEELAVAEAEIRQAIQHAISPEQKQAFEKMLGEVAKLSKEHRDFDLDGDEYLAAIKAGQRARAAELARKIAHEELQMISEFTNIVAEIKSETLHNARLATSMEKSGQIMVVAVSLCGLLVGVMFAWFTARNINRLLRSVAGSLNEGANQTASAAGQVSSASQILAEGASEQAASLEETSASIEELSSITRRNAENAQRANDLARQTRSAADTGAADMDAMNQAMEAIKASSDDIAKIIKTIDEIAFQTNILALNAAVEAARAGEAGMGFAVVADEVRNLAQRCADSAKETASKIEGAITRTSQGVELSAKVSQGLQEIVSKIRQVDELAAEVANASSEQSTGITQVSTAVSQMDKVTQSNAASAEESAAAAEEMNGQAELLKRTVGELMELIEGKNGNTTAGAIPVLAAPASTRTGNGAPRGNPAQTFSAPRRQTSMKVPAAASHDSIPLPTDGRDF